MKPLAYLEFIQEVCSSYLLVGEDVPRDTKENLYKSLQALFSQVENLEG